MTPIFNQSTTSLPPFSVSVAAPIQTRDDSVCHLLYFIESIEWLSSTPPNKLHFEGNPVKIQKKEKRKEFKKDFSSWILTNLPSCIPRWSYKEVPKPELLSSLCMIGRVDPGSKSKSTRLFYSLFFVHFQFIGGVVEIPARSQCCFGCQRGSVFETLQD